MFIRGDKRTNGYIIKRRFNRLKTAAEFNISTSGSSALMMVVVINFGFNHELSWF